MICLCDNGSILKIMDNTNENIQLNYDLTPTPPQSDKELDDKLIQIDNVIDFNNLSPNSVIVLKIGGDTGHKLRMHHALMRFIQSKGELFKEKHLTILFLEPGDELEVLTEKDMEKAGWTKKEKSLIIKPDEA